MAHTMQEALFDAGLTPHSKQAKREVASILAEPEHPARGLPKWLTRNGRMTGPITDFYVPLQRGRRVWLIHPSNTTYTEVISASPWGAGLAKVQLAGEDQPRKFSTRARVKYVITGKNPTK